MVSLIERLREPFRRKTEKEKTAFQESFEEEKKLVAKEREAEEKARAEARIQREAERGKRAIRNPFFKRLAKKAGAIGKKGIELAAAKISEQSREIQKAREGKEKAIRKARTKEITRAAVRGVQIKQLTPLQPIQRRQVPDLGKGLGDILGINEKVKRSPVIGDIGFNEEKQERKSIIGQGDVLGLNNNSGKKINLVDGIN